MIIQTVSSGIIDLFMVLRKNKIRHLPVEAIITMFTDPGVLDLGWDKVLTHLLMSSCKGKIHEDKTTKFSDT